MNSNLPDFSDSIDDIIGLLNKESSVYQKQPNSEVQQVLPLQQQKFSEIENKQTQSTQSMNKDYDTLHQFCDLYNKKSKNAEETKQNEHDQFQNKINTQLDTSGYKTQQVNPRKIRYLQFRPWSGKPTTEEKDYGYYYKFVNNNHNKLIAELLEENGFRKTPNNDWSIGWNCGAIQPAQYSQLMAYQKVNHFPRSIEITRKDLMNRNISKMQQIHGIGQFNFIPKTFILPNETQIFIEDAEKSQKNDIWYICKPSGSSQGKGIFITDNAQEVLAKQINGQSTVVCHYIKNPLLINNLKFDLRIYVAMTSINPLRIYIYNEGLCRFATNEYNMNQKSLGNVFAHLTNYSLNKYSDQFIQNNNASDDFHGSKWSLTALKDFLRTQNINVDALFEKIDDMIIKTILSIENMIYGAFEMQVPFRNNCFEVLGFDVLIDSNLKPWVLEVNLSPSLNTDSPIDLKIKGSMISDLFTMIGVVPTDQRYCVDTSYAFTSNSALKSDKIYANIINRAKNTYSNQEMSSIEKYILKESEDELKRSRNFRRLYPSPYCMKYKNYFEVERPFNFVLWNNELSKSKIASTNTNSITNQIKNQNNQNISLQQIHNNQQQQGKTQTINTGINAHHMTGHPSSQNSNKNGQQNNANTSSFTEPNNRTSTQASIHQTSQSPMQQYSSNQSNYQSKNNSKMQQIGSNSINSRI